METNKKKKNYAWGMFLPLITIVLVQLAVEIFSMELIFIYKISSYKEGAYIDFINDILKMLLDPSISAAVSVVYAVICSVIFAYFYIRDFSSKEKARSPFRNMTSNAAFFIVGLLVFSVGMQYVCNYFSNAVAIMRPDWYSDYEALLKASGLEDNITVPMAIYACVLAPICEELAFRGLTFKNMQKVMPIGFAIVLQAAFFAGFHQNMFQATYTFVVGLGLGYVMYRYDNIIVVILIHMLYNIVGTFLTDYLPLGGESYIEYFLWLLGSLIVSYAGILFLQKAVPEVNVEE